MSGLITAINIAYEEKETRGFLKLNLIAIGLTLGLLAGGIVAIALPSSSGRHSCADAGGAAIDRVRSYDPAARFVRTAPIEGRDSYRTRAGRVPKK